MNRGNLIKRSSQLAITNLAQPKYKAEKIDISLPAQIEAVLYLKGKPLTTLDIGNILNKSPTMIEEALLALQAGYSQRDTALEIRDRDGK